MNVPIRIGALSILPKDIVVADANGILSIPPARVQEAVGLASEVGQKENTIKNQILSGHTIFDIFNLEQHVTASQRAAAKTK